MNDAMMFTNAKAEFRDSLRTALDTVFTRALEETHKYVDELHAKAVASVPAATPAPVIEAPVIEIEESQFYYGTHVYDGHVSAYNDYEDLI